MTAPEPSQERYLERVRWRCRRGLLELDIVLGRFIERHYAGLDAAQHEAFDALLDLPDTELWQLISRVNDLQDGKNSALTENSDLAIMPDKVNQLIVLALIQSA